MKVLRLRGDTWDDFAGWGLNFHTTSTHVFRHWQDAWRVGIRRSSGLPSTQESQKRASTTNTMTDVINVLQ